MAFPPAAYKERGGVGAVCANRIVTNAKANTAQDASPNDATTFPQTPTPEPDAGAPDGNAEAEPDGTEIMEATLAPTGWRHDPFDGRRCRPSSSGVGLMDQPPPRRVLRAMQRALDVVPDTDRPIFLRCRFDGWDHARIALAILALDAAAGRHHRGCIWAWLRAKLPQGWRR